MGQKTHPLGFRLGITQDHKSTWYSNLNQYAKVLKEDDTIRTYIGTIAKSKSISNVQIKRNGLNDQIQLNIETGKPGVLVGDLGTGLETLLTNVKKLLPSNRHLTINVFEVEKVDLDASLLADLVVEQLEKRVAFRRAIREALQRAQKQNVKGIKIQVSGRLNGAEIARSEWIREGRVPLQTLRADIDYATKEANTIYGILGIKVWLFRSEILSK
uniref:ribosomal protein S3 n=1 Tax=Gomphonema parvulum TaxID=97227 RepID=UPI0021F97DF6|nr:ribosomal protein S3 [Gomphonema parvulum]UXX44837.1 ribosomal protein S3 [Gomphonema parvulum]